MIKFFRHIRKALLMENKTSKYVKYAIGEIFLVVIGILIALQINNCNESIKARNYEFKILHEIRKDLILDTIYFNAIKSRPKRAEWAVDRLRAMKMENAIVNDSIPYLVWVMGIGYKFVYHDGAYESLKSVGLDKISNDSLRNSLSNMYGFYFPRTKNMIAPREMRINEFMDKTIEMLFEYDVYNPIPKGPPLPKPKMSLDSLFENDRFKLSFYNVKSTSIDVLHRIESITKNVTNLLQLIDKELQIEDPLKNIPTKDWSQ